ncbi:MAG: hypothetical protein QGH33_12245 [Pirellulaceae bacterium]|jgi:hypothetical protein|nr:hypothetical protein [Pirellulaceae bacterium]
MAGPLKKFRAGQITCALWENDAKVNGRSVRMLKATVERRYKDKKGVWQSSGSFGRNDIPLVKYCLDKAFEAITEEQNVQMGEEVE